MEKQIKNYLGSERSVEIPFVKEMLKKYLNNSIALDVGGIGTLRNGYDEIDQIFKEKNSIRKISDFRPCDYQGDFVKYNFEEEKFDIILFLSSIEHFPQCTESDKIFRENYDVAGFIKALSILKPNGKIILTVPFGKHQWYNYHQSYNKDGILKLSNGSKIIEEYKYLLNENTWNYSNEIGEIENPGPIFGVGCFVFERE